MTEIDWDAPLNADGRERPAALRSALEIQGSRLDQFLDELDEEISAEDWGFHRLSELTEVNQRGLVSDQLLSAGHGLLDAMVDAAVTVRDLSEYTGPTGIPYPDRMESLNDMLRSQRLRQTVSAFFDAVGTALDCLAALLVVVVRAPFSVQRADFAQLRKLDVEAQYGGAFEEEVPPAQRELWGDLLQELSEGVTVGPEGWLDWSLEMRNALTHRGQVTNIYMPRPISGRLAVPPTTRPEALYRYDLHLRRRPWLPEIEGMLAGAGLPESWLDEPATRTVAGLRDALQAYTERLITWARGKWQDPSAELIAPVKRWVLPDPPDLDFRGIAPGGTTPIQGATGGINPEHIRLAEKLRLRREEATGSN